MAARLSPARPRLRGDALRAALTRYLDATMDAPFVWGSADCCAWAAGWVIRLTGRDPMARWRGRYAGANDARAAMGLGGLRTAFRAGCCEAGLIVVEPPRDGDVGLVETPDGPAAAIRSGGLWVGRAHGGLCWHARGDAAMGAR